MLKWLMGVLAMTILPTAVPAAPGTAYYVAPGGRDSWSGTLPAANARKTDGPFATLARARDAIREMKARDGGLKAPVTVWVRGGFYALPETLAFEAQDSGTVEFPLTYAAYRDEKPVISGGRRIADWRKGEGALWTAQIPEVAEGKWYFRQLFVNGARRTRARTPNEGYLRAEGPLAPLANREAARRDAATKIGFRYKGDDLKRWADLEDVNVVVYHSWTASWHHVAEVNEQERTVRFTAPAGWPMGYWEKEQRYVVENLREALDSPGEWYLDRKTGVLTYWPMPGEDPRRVEIVAPMLQTLVRFAGDPDNGQYVENLRLVGLSFQHADWDLPRERSADGQAATFLMGGAVTGSGMRGCALERCEIAHVGGHGLWLTRGCQNNSIVQCHLHDLGAGAIYVGEQARAQVPAVATGENLIHNNFLHDGGHVFPAGIGVWIGQSADNTVSHNEVCDFFYSGMSVGWTWGYGPSACRGNLIEYNHIHNFGKGVLSDMGGVYTLGVQPGTIVRNNVIHDVLSYSYGGWGLYTDEGSSTIVMENNVVYRTKSGGFHQHYGRENRIRNNVFATASEGEIIRSRQEEHVSFFFENNVVYQTLGPLLGGNWSNHNYRMDRNLYWHAGDQNELNGLLLDEWREETGQDRNSLMADPQFENAVKLDFRLKRSSPAFRLGFQPIDLSSVGLVGEKAWVDLPRKVKREPLVLPEPAPRQRVDDGFEATPVGQMVAFATSQESGDTSLRVTDETAASSKRSLKFVDAKAASVLWHPHLYYKPSFLRGVVRVSYDLRVEPGAIAWMECRDAASPYNAGPSLTVREGQLHAGKEALLPIPAGRWVHYEITVSLGKQATGAYDLAVTLPGGEVKRFEKLPLAKAAFTKLQWFGFMSMAEAPTVFYLDNVKVETVE